MELAESTGCSVYGTVTVVRIGSMIVAVGIPEHTVVDARKQSITNDRLQIDVEINRSAVHHNLQVTSCSSTISILTLMGCLESAAVARVRRSFWLHCFMLASVDSSFRTINRSLHRTPSAKSFREQSRPHCARRKFAITMSVQEYIDKHDLSKKVEEVINACVKAKPEEPISFMVRQMSLELPEMRT